MNTENKKIDNLEEVIVIDSDEESEKDETIHQHKRKCDHKRKHKSDHAKTDKLRISQRVELNKDKLSYVINVNAKISDIEDQIQSKHSYKNKQNETDNIKRKCKDKIVPGCLRRQCSSLIRCKAFDCRRKKAKERLLSNRNYLRAKYKEVLKKSNRNHQRKPFPNNNPSYTLSSISTSSLKENSTDRDVTPRSTISYDDISLDSMPFRNNRLDMLIKRTRQRERKMKEETSRQVTEHQTTHRESEDLSVFSFSSDLSIYSKATLIFERKLDDTISSPNSNVYSSHNVSDKTKYKSYANKRSIKSAKMKKNKILDFKNTSKGYKNKCKNKVETYIPNLVQELNVINYPNRYIKSNNYSATSTYVPNYPQSEFNYPLNFNVNSEYKSNANSDMPLNYHYPKPCNNELCSYYLPQFNNIDYRYTPENYTLPPNNVDYLVNLSNNKHNGYTDLNNYPVNFHQAPLSGGIPYDNSRIMSQFPENIDSYMTANSQNNFLYDPVTFESWSMGYNPNYPIN